MANVIKKGLSYDSHNVQEEGTLCERLSGKSNN